MESLLPFMVRCPTHTLLTYRSIPLVCLALLLVLCEISTLLQGSPWSLFRLMNTVWIYIRAHAMSPQRACAIGKHAGCSMWYRSIRDQSLYRHTHNITGEFINRLTIWCLECHSGILIIIPLMLLVANLAKTKWCKKTEKLVKPWEMFLCFERKWPQHWKRYYTLV